MATCSRYARFKRWDRADKSDCVNSDRQKRSIVSALRSQKEKKKEEKEKFALWLYNCPATLSAVYVLSFQVYRAALFLHGSSGTGALMQALRIEVSTVTSGKHSAKKVKESRSLLHFFFSLLPSFLRYARNKSRIFAIWIFARFNSLLSRLLSLFFFFIALEMYETLYCIQWSSI